MTAVSWADARRIAHDAGASAELPAEDIPLASALGRRLAADVVAAIDIPHFASSAMDGWAVAGAGPWRVRTSGRLTDGDARPVVTGEAVGPDVLGILRSEFARVEGGMLHRSASAKDGEPGPLTHVRPAAREALAGDVLLGAGIELDPVHLAVAAAATSDVVRVRAVPGVALITTGDEIAPSGVPGPGRVRDTFGPMMPGMIASIGGAVSRVEPVADDPDALRAALERASATDLIVTTGGTGHSSADHVRDVLADLGAEVVIPRLALRPGAPGRLARLPAGAWVVNLPGNPLAAVAALLTLAEPLLAGLTGRPLSPLSRYRSAARLDGAAGSVSLVPVRLEDDIAHASARRGSGMLRGLAASDALLVVPPDGVDADAIADALPLPWRKPQPAARAADQGGRMTS